MEMNDIDVFFGQQLDIDIALSHGTQHSRDSLGTTQQESIIMQQLN